MPPKHPATPRTSLVLSATWPKKPILKLSRKLEKCLRKLVGIKSCRSPPSSSPKPLQASASPTPKTLCWFTRPFLLEVLSTKPFFISWSSFKCDLSFIFYTSQNLERSYILIAPKVLVKYWFSYKKITIIKCMRKKGALLEDLPIIFSNVNSTQHREVLILPLLWNRFYSYFIDEDHSN